jgi:hypothetical protein
MRNDKRGKSKPKLESKFAREIHRFEADKGYNTALSHYCHGTHLGQSGLRPDRPWDRPHFFRTGMVRIGKIGFSELTGKSFLLYRRSYLVGGVLIS